MHFDNMLLKRRSFRGVDYQPIRNSDSFLREQFVSEPSRVPVKSLCFAFFLLTLGLTLLLTTGLHLSGYISDKYADRMWPVFIMGCIMVLPGAYYTRIGIYAYFKIPGYSYDDIPEYD